MKSFDEQVKKEIHEATKHIQITSEQKERMNVMLTKKLRPKQNIRYATALISAGIVLLLLAIPAISTGELTNLFSNSGNNISENKEATKQGNEESEESNVPVVNENEEATEEKPTTDLPTVTTQDLTIEDIAYTNDVELNLSINTASAIIDKIEEIVYSAHSTYGWEYDTEIPDIEYKPVGDSLRPYATEEIAFDKLKNTVEILCTSCDTFYLPKIGPYNIRYSLVESSNESFVLTYIQPSSGLNPDVSSKTITFIKEDEQWKFSSYTSEDLIDVNLNITVEEAKQYLKNIGEEIVNYLGEDTIVSVYDGKTLEKAHIFEIKTDQGIVKSSLNIKNGSYDYIFEN